MIVLSLMVVYRTISDFLIEKEYIPLIVFIPTIIGFTIGWILYFISLEYLKRKRKWTDYTGFGPLIFSKGYDIVKPAGKKYAMWSSYFLGGTVIYVLASLILLKMLGLL